MYQLASPALRRGVKNGTRSRASFGFLPDDDVYESLSCVRGRIGMIRRVVRYTGSVRTGCLALLLMALVLSPARAADLIINLEEPVDGGTSSGVSNIRGWAVASDGIERIEVYFDGVFGFEVPYGASREDVGAIYPDIVGSINSGFGSAMAYGLLGNGEHTVTVRAVSLTGDMAEDSARFEVVGFPYDFLSADESPNLEGASVSLAGDSVVINDVILQDGEDYAVTLGWLTASQGFEIRQVTPAVTNPAEQDILVSAFFGLDNELSGLLCNQPGRLLDGMPVNFKFPIDVSSLSETDFEVLDSLGNIHTPDCVSLAPADEDGENRTVLLLGELGTAVTNPPVEVRVVGDLFTTDTASGESACSEIINLNGITTTNVVPLDDGPSLFFAQEIFGDLNECDSGAQTIQVAWNGGVTPYIDGDTESDLFQYYVGYSDNSGVLIPHIPISIRDIDDQDNFHQLCFATSDEIVKISMLANTVEDPNQDPNRYSRIDVASCTALNE